MDVQSLGDTTAQLWFYIREALELDPYEDAPGLRKQVEDATQ